jgi:hypothetical protein
VSGRGGRRPRQSLAAAVAVVAHGRSSRGRQAIARLARHPLQDIREQCRGRQVAADAVAPATATDDAQSADTTRASGPGK